jgi:hypothetical protein
VVENAAKVIKKLSERYCALDTESSGSSNSSCKSSEASYVDSPCGEKLSLATNSQEGDLDVEGQGRQFALETASNNHRIQVCLKYFAISLRNQLMFPAASSNSEQKRTTQFSSTPRK